MKFPARRLIIAGGFAVAVAAAPAIGFVATPAPSGHSARAVPGRRGTRPLHLPLRSASGAERGFALPGDRWQPRPAGGHHPGRRRRHSVYRPQLRSVHRPGRRGGGRRTGSGASVNRGQQPDGHRLRGQYRIVAGADPGARRGRIYGGVMATKSDPAELGDVEPLADSTARQARRVVAAYATDADECRIFLSMLGIGPAKLEA